MPSDPGVHTRMLSCTRCKRLNRSDARFCDWCGSKVNAHLTPKAVWSEALWDL